MAVSDAHGPISGFVVADDMGNAVIKVAPQLSAGDTIEVRQWACGGQPLKARLAVQSIERVTVPVMGSAFYGKAIIDIKGLLPGAMVEVVVTAKDGSLKETTLFVARDETVTANLQSPLGDGEKVKARQALCSQISGYSSDSLTMVEPIKADWWGWSGQNPQNQAWKEEYTVSGTFTNKGSTKIQDFAVTIFEDAANVGTTNLNLVLPAGTAPGATTPIKKDWQWFVPGVWYVKGPLYKEFHYKALMTAKDVVGNPYVPTNSADLIVFVNVSKIKRTSGAYAMGAAASAAAMAASIFLIVPAAAAYAAASAAGAVALDPPEPDPNYQERVPLPPLGSVPSTGNTRNLVLFFRLSERVMLIDLAKSSMESKRMGALAHDDDAWVQIQAQDIISATTEQHDLITQIKNLAQTVKTDWAALMPPDIVPARLQLKSTGLTDDLANQMGLPQVLRPGFDMLLRSDVALTNPDIPASVDDILAQMIEYGSEL